MNIALIDRYRKHVEASIWLLILGLVVFVLLWNTPEISLHRPLLLVILIVAALYTAVYYHLVAPRYNNEHIVLSSILVYTVFVISIIHYTGSLQSILFALIFIPILISALLIGIKAMASVILVEILWMTSEYFLYFQNLEPTFIDGNKLLWERILAIVLVAFVSYTNSKEIFTRQFEHELLIKEKDKLNRLKQREDAVLGSIQEMVVALNSSGEVLFANQSLLDFIDKKPEDVFGRNYRDSFNVYEVDQLGTLVAEQDLLLTNEYTLYYQPQVDEEDRQYKLMSGGHEAFIKLTNTPLKSNTDGEEQSHGAVVIIRNVNEERQLELMKLDFVSMAAHELRTPITAIRGYLDALQEEAWERLEEDEKKFVQRATIAAQQLSTLMENLLSVSRIEKGTYNLSRKEIDWVKLISSKVEEFAPRAHERNLNLTWTPPTEDIPPVYADPLRIMEVVNNLIANAINYTSEGGISISVEVDSKAQMVTTHVADTGQGIPQEAIPHIFEKFFRVSGVLEQGSKGTGLGLYISKQIVKLHHGKIWVKSKEGEGSTFSFSLPTIYNSVAQEESEQKTILNEVYG